MTSPYAPTIFNQSISFFDPANAAQQAAILPAQTSISQPQAVQLNTATGMTIPDWNTTDRMANFSPDQYDLSDTSHLVRFMRAILGESGIGQMRKRLVIARLSTALTSTHFFDLDGFYGAIFGASRNDAEQLDINPFTDTATAAEWDDIRAADASYRERITQLATAINLGGTVPGLVQAAEAVLGCPVDLYEVWQIADEILGVNPTLGGRTFDDVQQTFGTFSVLDGMTWDEIAFPQLTPDTPPQVNTWDEVIAKYGTFGNIEAAGALWGDLDVTPSQPAPGSSGIGRSPRMNRHEVIIRAKKVYSTDPAGNRQRAVDQYQVQRVLSKIKPAQVLLTIDNSGLALHTQVPIRALGSDSEYWEVNVRVTPRTGLTITGTTPYPISAGQAAQNVATTDPHTLPQPPFSRSSGEFIPYNADVVAVKSYALAVTNPTMAPTVGLGAQVASTDNDTEVYFDGTKVIYTPDKAVMDARSVLAGRYSSDGILTAAPYSDARKPVVSHS